MRSGSLLPPVALLIGGFMFVWIPHVGVPNFFWTTGATNLD
jgi:hypothetical protein